MILDLTAEQTAFRVSVERIAAAVVRPRAASIDDTAQFPLEVLRALAGHGLLGLTLPATYGGAGMDTVCYAVAVEALARESATVAVSIIVHTSLVGDLLAHAGTDRQKADWLPRLAAGEALGAFALSEPDAGTDAANQQTRAVRTTGGYRVTGRKVWVANAAAASVAVVFANTTPGRRAQGITAFLVRMDAPGVTKLGAVDSLGVRGLGCMDLDIDVEVADDQVLGPVDGGFPLALWALERGRIAVAAQALGIGEAALEEAVVHAKRREAFGGPIARFEAVQWMIADAAAELAAARVLTWRAATVKDQTGRAAVEASMAKLAASQAACFATDQAMQVLASAGYRRGSLVERLFRDARATEIYQGTSEAQRLVIANGLLGPA
jgi:alkylation response protein AidB-like acyl-CoA dehydrogenase